MAWSIVEISSQIVDSLILPKILDLIVNLGEKSSEMLSGKIKVCTFCTLTLGLPVKQGIANYARWYSAIKESKQPVFFRVKKS